MGKRKIGEIYNKPIIEGDINLKTSNEIHIDEMTNVSTNGGGSKWRYFDVTQVPKDLFVFRTSLIAMLARCVDATNDAILVGSYAFGIDPSMIKAIGVDLSVTIASSEYNFERITMEQYLNDAGFLENCASLGFVEITEDEFLNKTFV